MTMRFLPIPSLAGAPGVPLISLLLVLLAMALPAAAAPEVGEPAPPFSFEGISDGAKKSWTLSDYVGEGARKKGVVVAWFPKAFTPG